MKIYKVTHTRITGDGFGMTGSSYRSELGYYATREKAEEARTEYLKNLMDFCKYEVHVSEIEIKE